jgi:hypothetical protein
MFMGSSLMDEGWGLGLTDEITAGLFNVQVNVHVNVHGERRREAWGCRGLGQDWRKHGRGLSGCPLVSYGREVVSYKIQRKCKFY